MAWTAELKSVSKENGNVVAVVEFVNGDERVTATAGGDTLDEPTLADWCFRKIATFTARDSAYSTLALGPVDVRQKPAQEP